MHAVRSCDRRGDALSGTTVLDRRAAGPVRQSGTGHARAKAGLDLANLTWGGFLFKNIIPVTLGNIIGGSVFVALLYWSVYQRNSKHHPVVA